MPTFAVRPPVLTIKPGDTVETETFSRPGDYYDPKVAGPWPGEVGPFAIEGRRAGRHARRPHPEADAEPRHRDLERHAERHQRRRGRQPHADAERSAAGRAFVWQIDRARMVGILDLPARRASASSCRCVRCWAASRSRPAGEEAWGGLWPGDFGGNMDASDVGQGATVYLPVFHPGALFYFGDFHALQGDGEIVGSGLESTADVTFQFDLIKGKAIRWPRIENDEHIMVAGSVRPLIDALRIAYVELIEWLVADYGFDKMEAYQVASQAGVVRVANVVDPNYTVVAKFPKRFLPPRR